MRIEISNSIKEFDYQWDTLISSVYQKQYFLLHAEKHNPCQQRYYLAYNDDNQLVSGAVVYTSKVNVLTFAKYCINLPMTIIGIPVSVDAPGLVGEKLYFPELINAIFKSEEGIILCNNYESKIPLRDIIEMQTLPTLIRNGFEVSWEAYLKTLRHGYRRRILKAESKFNNIKTLETMCMEFSDDHYNLYMNIMNRTKTKIETLSKIFFTELPKEFRLHSFYINNKLITWHISIFEKGTYYFLFGGINYELRDKYDAYYNNLIQIIKEAIRLKSKSVNFGQTSEVSKNRLGAKFMKKKMFLFHKSILIRLIFRYFKNFLSYEIKSAEVNIYKKNLQT